MEKRITFRAKDWLLEQLLKEKDVSKLIRQVLMAYYRGEKK